MTASRAAIERELLAWMREEPEHLDDERFERLALALFAEQFELNPVYGRFCAARGATPERVRRWHEIPTVPTGAFKEVALRCFPAKRTVKVFRTSGTTLERRGELHLDTLALYEASLVPSFEAGVLPDLAPGERLPILVLAPSPSEADDSSLSHMFGVMVARRGTAGSGFFVQGGRLEAEALLTALERAVDESPRLLLCGTAFAFVHWLEALGARGLRLTLPAGVRLMETGGFKGRARELSRTALYARIEERLGVPPVRCVNQYGMTELGSQFYDSVLAAPEAPRHKRIPPWTRVRIVEPESGRPLGPDAVGAIQVFDLANTGSVLAIATADLGVRRGEGFEVLGREASAEARGCSLAADEMLGAGA
ncbi:MAG: long-chain fatty acid--CoA ligase [Myxococcota bacterium]